MLSEGKTMNDEDVEEAEHMMSAEGITAIFDANSVTSSAMEGRVYEDVVADSEQPRLRPLVGRLRSMLDTSGTGVGDLGTGSTESSSRSGSIVSLTAPLRGSDRLRLLPLGKE